MMDRHVEIKEEDMFPVQEVVGKPIVQQVTHGWHVLFTDTNGRKRFRYVLTQMRPRSGKKLGKRRIAIIIKECESYADVGWLDWEEGRIYVDKQGDRWSIREWPGYRAEEMQTTHLLFLYTLTRTRVHA